MKPKRPRDSQDEYDQAILDYLRPAATKTEERPPQVLDYAAPDSNRPAGGVPYGGQAVLGLLALVGTFILGIALTAAIVRSQKELSGIALLGLAVSFTALAVLSHIARSRWRWPGFALGIRLGLLIGVGLILLAVGLCFAAFSR